jgi:hypothetical protein
MNRFRLAGERLAAIIVISMVWLIYPNFITFKLISSRVSMMV